MLKIELTTKAVSRIDLPAATQVGYALYTPFIPAGKRRVYLPIKTDDALLCMSAADALAQLTSEHADRKLTVAGEFIRSSSTSSMVDACTCLIVNETINA
jgi:hypothetical protein